MSQELISAPTCVTQLSASNSLEREVFAASSRSYHSVAVVITTYDHAHFLADAIISVLTQRHPVSEIIVVDDGSTDDPSSVVARYPEVRLIRQSNRGLAAARNTGLRAAKSDAIVFLDADDRLLADAIGDGLLCLAREPRSGLVYGGHRRTDVSWHAKGEDRYEPMRSPYTDLLQGNSIGMHAAVMYWRERLEEIGGFDADLRRCEDYDVYLRMARSYPITSHPGIVAEYRIHGKNMSVNQRDMLRWVLKVHGRQKRLALAHPREAEAWRRGRTIWREYYSHQAMLLAKQAWLQEGETLKAIRQLLQAVFMSPSHAVRMVVGKARQRLRGAVPAIIRQRIHQFKSRRGRPAVGRVRFGDLGGDAPIDDDFGFGRGTPIDRGYIAEFLSRHAGDIAGRVLEVGDDEYSCRFGASRIVQQDILHVHGGNLRATIVGDLAKPGVLPPAAFDCLVLTQTLHLIYDMRAAVREMYRALKPGGVVLLTVPGISRIDRGEWGKDWYWSLTEGAARRMFSEEFGAQRVEVETYGNVFAAVAFLHGLSLEEVPSAKLNARDPAFPVIVSVRAQRSLEH